LLNIDEFREIGAGKAVLVTLAKIKLNVDMYRETMWQSDGQEPSRDELCWHSAAWTAYPFQEQRAGTSLLSNGLLFRKRKLRLFVFW